MKNLMNKDKYLGMITLGVISVMCVVFRVDFAKEVVMMSVPVLAAVIRD